MMRPRVLIVEDNGFISLDMEQVLLAAGFGVCGIARFESQAIDLAARLRPEMAIVDISLSPGDGRVVAKHLCRVYATAALLATGQCDEVAAMRGAGAMACLPKPYDAGLVPDALRAVGRMAEGEHVGRLPDRMSALAA